MLTSRSAIGCAALATILAIVCHPRVFFGTGAAMSIVSFDDAFFAGQWAALALASLSLLLSVATMRTSSTAAAPFVIAAFSLVLLVYLIATGIPHPANRGDWANRELGIAAFVRGIARHQKANAKPVPLTAAAFAGDWRAGDGSVFAFAPDALSWTSASGKGEYSASVCGASFSIQYTQHEREVLQEMGLTWSPHAIATYDATPVDAKIPMALVICGTSDRTVFIRATTDEVWRWTSAMDANDLKGTDFVLRRVVTPQ